MAKKDEDTKFPIGTKMSKVVAGLTTRDKQREKEEASGKQMNALGRPVEWHVMDPDVAYPEVIAHIRNGVAMDLNIEQVTREVNKLAGSKGWDLALKPVDKVRGNEENLKMRAECLEAARRYFTAVLKLETGDLGLRIVKRPAWALS